MKILTPIVSAAQSFTDTQKVQVRANIGVLSAGDTLTLLQNKLNKPSIVRSSYNINDSSSADNTLYTYTATAPCIIDLSVSIYANSPTLSGTLGLMVRWEPVNDSYDTDYFVLKDADHGSAFSRCVKTLSTGDVFRCAILNGNTSYPYTASGLIMGYMFTL